MFVKTFSGRKQCYKWTLDDAKAWQLFCPSDKAVQFIARQFELKSRSERYGGFTQEQLRNELLRQASGQRMQSVNMFSILSGSMAVQESLQLDASLRAAEAGSDPTGRGRTISISDLAGPSAKSHPWEEMLGAVQPKVSELSKHAPCDFFYIEGRSASSMQEILLNANSFAQIFQQQAHKQSVDLAIADSYRAQLYLDDSLLEKIGNWHLEELAVCGSDLYFQNGTDITVLCRFSDSAAQELFRKASELSGAKTRQELEHEIIEVVGRDSNARMYACNLNSSIHVRSNSIEALRRIIEASSGLRQSLGQSTEFKYIRSLMPCDDKAEDVFVYFSDPFIRKMIGSEIRISQHRRLTCRQNLESIDHAILLFCAEIGRMPESLEEILRTGLCPELMNCNYCVEGGEYALPQSSGSSDNASALVCARCRIHGQQSFMTPNIDCYAPFADAAEANEYKQFVTAYDQYWRTFFDPIGIQIKCEDGRYVARTIVLPLINNSAYNGLHELIGASEPEDLSSADLSPETIMSVWAKLKKGALKDKSKTLKSLFRQNGQSLNQLNGMDALVIDGFGEKIGFHVWDAEPTFSLDLSALLGLSLMGGQGTRLFAVAGQFLWIGGLLASLNRPVYATVSVNDSKLIDRFLDQLEPILAKADFVGRGMTSFDYSRLQANSELTIHACSWQFGPAKFRLFFARIDDTFYLSTRKSVIEAIFSYSRRNYVPISNSQQGKELECGHANGSILGAPTSRRLPNDKSAPSNEELARKSQIAFEVNHENWNKVKADADLLWLDNNRRSCLKNLAPLTVLARALASLSDDGNLLPGDLANAAHSQSSLGAKALCPDGGVYNFDAASGNVFCSLHGGLGQSRQIVKPAQHANASNVLLNSLKRSCASLTFLEDGLHGELVVERKKESDLS